MLKDSNIFGRNFYNILNMIAKNFKLLNDTHEFS